MRVWEYRKISFDETSFRSEVDLLCEAGEEGWELVTVLHSRFAYLKRAVDGGSGSDREPKRLNRDR